MKFKMKICLIILKSKNLFTLTSDCFILYSTVQCSTWCKLTVVIHFHVHTLDFSHSNALNADKVINEMVNICPKLRKQRADTIQYYWVITLDRRTVTILCFLHYCKVASNFWYCAVVSSESFQLVKSFDTENTIILSDD